FPASSLPLEEVMSLEGWLKADRSRLPLQASSLVCIVQQLNYLVKGVLAGTGRYPSKYVWQGREHGTDKTGNLVIHSLDTGYDLCRVLFVDAVAFQLRLGALRAHHAHYLTGLSNKSSTYNESFSRVFMMCRRL